MVMKMETVPKAFLSYLFNFFLLEIPKQSRITVNLWIKEPIIFIFAFSLYANVCGGRYIL